MKTNVINLGNKLVNCWAYPIEDGYVIIDTGYKSNYRVFRKKLKKNHISIDAIKYCFLTHSHDDHTGFLARLMTINKDMRVIIHSEALEVLRKGQNNFGGCTNKSVYAFYKMMVLFGKGKHLFPPITPEMENRIVILDENNKDEIERVLGGKIIENTGHTKDSISLMLADGTLFFGDVAMNGFPSKHNVSVWAEDEELYPQAWQKIISLKPALIFPGHGKPFDYKQLEKNLSFAEKIKIFTLNND